MNENVLGPVLSVAVFVAGISVGWRAARLKDGEVSIPTHGFGRGAAKPVRVAVVGFGGAVLAFLLRFLSVQIESLALAYVAVAAIVVSIGVIWGAVMRGWRGMLRSSRDGMS